jgi:hypothetical protein
MPASPDDPKPTQNILHIRDFPGYTPAVDPHDMPTGASIVQINVMSVRPGELRVRHGLGFLKFDR